MPYPTDAHAFSSRIIRVGVIDRYFPDDELEGPREALGLGAT